MSLIKLSFFVKILVAAKASVPSMAFMLDGKDETMRFLVSYKISSGKSASPPAAPKKILSISSGVNAAL